MHYHRGTLPGSSRMQGKSWTPGGVTYKRIVPKDEPEAQRADGRRKVRTENSEERSASRKKVEDAHREAEEAEHRARGADATPEMVADAARKRHDANLAHVEHSDRYDSVEAHEAAEAGRDRFWDSQVASAGGGGGGGGSRFTEAEPKMHVHPAPHGFLREAEPKMFVHPALHGFLREAEPKMFVNPTPHGFAQAPQTFVRPTVNGYQPTGKVNAKGIYEPISDRIHAG